VARSLTLFDPLGADDAPLVVDRTCRDVYRASLAAASQGDLSRLVRLFVQLEIVALRSELHPPAEVPAGGPATVARAYAERIHRARESRDEARRQAADRLVEELHRRLQERLTEVGDELKEAFGEVDPRARARIDAASPPASAPPGGGTS